VLLKFSLIFSFVSLFIFSCFLLLNFNNNLNIYADSIDGSKYALPHPPDVLSFQGVSFLEPVVTDHQGNIVANVKPSVFVNDTWQVYPSVLDPGFYQVFSGFSQGFFQVGFSLLPPPDYSAVNPFFKYVFLFFVFVSLLILTTLLYLNKLFPKFFNSSLKVILIYSIFLLLTAAVAGFSFIKVTSFSFFTIKNSFSLTSSEFDLAEKTFLSDSTGFILYESSPHILPGDTYGLSFFNSYPNNTKLSLSYLKLLLSFCKPFDGSKAAIYSNNSTCAASVMERAVKDHGSQGFIHLLNSEEASFFPELCEYSSRFATKHFDLQKIDYNLLNEYSVCNFSWINHLLSTQTQGFSSASDFFDYALPLCESLKGFSDISDFLVQHQCLRGVGVGLYKVVKNPEIAASLCLGVPSELDSGNCIEGVFLEAFRVSSLKYLYAEGESPFESVCLNVSSSFFGLCLRIIASSIIDSYSLQDFKDLCLSLGTNYTQGCSTGLGHMAFLSFSYKDLSSLGLICNNLVTRECFERFFLSHAAVPEADYEEILYYCQVFPKFISDSGNSDTFIPARYKESCAKVKEFIDSVSLSKRSLG
jgi:hypothetical protein